MNEEEREVRAARNQAMFRVVNEKIRELNQAFAAISEKYAIACECADPSCVETLEIRSSDYLAIRANPRRFAVLHGHVFDEVERVVEETDGYVVVEKCGAGADVAEVLDPRRRS